MFGRATSWTRVPYPVGVKNAGTPAPPALTRSARVPWWDSWPSNSCPAFQAWFKFHLRRELNLQLPLQILSLKLLVLAHIGTDLDEVNIFRTLRSDHQPSCESASAAVTTPVQSRPPLHCCSPLSGHCKGQKCQQEGHKL